LICFFAATKKARTMREQRHYEVVLGATICVTMDYVTTNHHFLRGNIRAIYAKKYDSNTYTTSV